MVVVVEQRYPMTVLILVGANGLPTRNDVFCCNYYFAGLLVACSSVQLDCLVDGGGDVENLYAFGDRGEFGQRCQLVSSSPCFVWDHERVHEFSRPRIFDLERLLVFQSLGTERAHDGDRHHSLKVVGQAWSRCAGSELVVNRCPS